MLSAKKTPSINNVKAKALTSNPKHEIRNPKQIPMTKIQNTCLKHLNLEFRLLFRISTFEFRI
jgi:hypothetical protein